jgi:hypothetical protein
VFIGSNNFFILRITVKKNDLLQTTDVANDRVLQTAVCLMPVEIGHYTGTSSNEI